ncbi:MAG: tetratricopeptide repeat protein [Thermoguttaceae bacterium]
MNQKPLRKRRSADSATDRRNGPAGDRAPQVRRLASILALAAGGAILAGWMVFRPGSAGSPALPPRPRQAPVAAASRLTILSPFEGTVFPRDIAPPRFQWKDGAAGVATWTIRVRCGEDKPPMQFASDRPQWTPPSQAWEQIKQRSLSAPAKVTIRGVGGPDAREPLSCGAVTIRTSGDEVGAPIFYREVNLPFEEAVKDPGAHIRWRFGTVSSNRQPPIVLEKLLVCGNCHSFSADGAVLGMDVDYANDKGSYAICPTAKEISLSEDRIITWSNYEREDAKKTFGLLSQVSPDGRYVASTVKDLSVFEAVDDLTFSQLFFPIRGILCIYDRETGTYRSLPGADQEEFVQSNPSWSPDGKYLVFARCEAYRGQEARTNELGLTRSDEIARFLAERGKFRYDLYRVPFNGGRGGKAEPLEGASKNGKSNYFARYSPDGRWIVFCQADSFMLLQPDSELRILPAKGGQARRLECNTSRMNSWHSWSPNSRWLVFSSKALTPYTQLCLAHVDADGRASPAVVLSNFTAPDMAANIPEFVNAAPDAIRSIRSDFIADLHHVRVADNLALAGQFDAAIEEIEKAVAINPRRGSTYRLWGVMLMSQDKLSEAEQRIRKAVELEPDDSRAYWNLAKIAAMGGRRDQAEATYRKAIHLDPYYATARIDFARLLLESGRTEEAAAQLAEAARVEPKNPTPSCLLGDLHTARGQRDQAVAAYASAIERAQASGDSELLDAIRQKLASLRP